MRAAIASVSPGRGGSIEGSVARRVECASAGRPTKLSSSSANRMVRFSSSSRVADVSRAASRTRERNFFWPSLVMASITDASDVFFFSACTTAGMDRKNASRRSASRGSLTSRGSGFENGRDSVPGETVPFGLGASAMRSARVKLRRPIPPVHGCSSARPGVSRSPASQVRHLPTKSTNSRSSHPSSTSRIEREPGGPGPGP
mmetsp:Transcript_6862/g.28067  ORF Transcript_6862/g.28067 Transcript_6862/m.28067 type:complete len:202 (+) Transcript_6862:236-841(+)